MLSIFHFSYRPTPPDGDHLAFVLGVSKKEMLINQDLLAVNRFLCCRGLPVIGQEDKVDSYRRAVINGSVFSCARMPASKLNNSYTVQYKDASERTQFGEIQRFFRFEKPPCCSGNKVNPKWISNIRDHTFFRHFK